MKSVSVLDAFPSMIVPKSSKFERVMIVQTHVYDGKNNKKSSIIVIIDVYLNNRNSFKFGAFGTTRDEKASTTLTLFIFLKIF